MDVTYCFKAEDSEETLGHAKITKSLDDSFVSFESLATESVLILAAVFEVAVAISGTAGLDDEGVEQFNEGGREDGINLGRGGTLDGDLRGGKYEGKEVGK